MENLFTFKCPNCAHTTILKAEDLFVRNNIVCEQCEFPFEKDKLNQIKKLATGLFELENSSPLYKKSSVKCYIEIPMIF